MTPAEVIAMRDELAGDLRAANDSDSPDIRFKELADWLIESGWVTNEPGRECVRLQARRGE